MNRGEIRTRILTAMNDDPLQPVRYDIAQQNRTILEGYETICEQALLERVTYRIPRRAGTMLYHLAGIGDNIQVPWRIWLPDLNRRLEPVELNDLDARHELWQTIQGDPYWWFPVDFRSFGIWPFPAQGGGILEVDCYTWPTDVLDDQGEFRAPDTSAHELLCLYGEAENYLRQWDTSRAIDLWQQFTQQSQGQHGESILSSRDHVRGNKPVGGRNQLYFGGV